VDSWLLDGGSGGVRERAYRSIDVLARTHCHTRLLRARTSHDFEKCCQIHHAKPRATELGAGAAGFGGQFSCAHRICGASENELLLPGRRCTGVGTRVHTN